MSDPVPPLAPWMRGLLATPGWILDALDGRPRIAADRSAEEVYPLVRRSAVHPEAHLALESGLHHHVDGDRVVAWQHRGRTAFAIGGLNAPPVERVGVLQSFVAATRARGVVRQLLFPLRADELEDAGRAGFAAVQVGVEAILPLPGLSLRGKRYEHVRQMRNRAIRHGVAVDEVSATDCPEAMEALYTAWLQSRRPTWRMKLLVGSPGLEAPFDRRYFVARTEDRMEGFVTVLPGPDGVWGLDVLCRRPDAAPGTMERLILHIAEQLRDEGAKVLSLGACPMADIPPGGPLGLEQVFRWLYRSRWGNRLFGFRNLHRFKQKFRPAWAPVYFAAAPRLGVVSLYRGCRMWGLY